MKYRVDHDAQAGKFLLPELDTEVEVVDTNGADIDAQKFAALCGTFNGYRRNKMPIPMPSMGGNVSVPVVFQLKIHLWNWMLANRYRATDLAERLNLHRQQAYRIMDFGYSSDLAMMEKAYAAFDLEINTSAVGK